MLQWSLGQLELQNVGVPFNTNNRASLHDGMQSTVNRSITLSILLFLMKKDPEIVHYVHLAK